LSQAVTPASDEKPVLARPVSVLLSHWKLLAIGTASFGILSLVSTLRAPKLYEGRATVLVTEVNVTDRASWRSQQNVMNTRTVLASSSLAAQVIQERGLDRPPHDLTPEKFVRLLRIEEVKGTDIIQVKVRLMSPQLAAQVANRVAELGVELNRRINLSGVESVQAVLGEEIEKARAQMRDVERRLLAFKESAQIDLARKDIESKLGQRGQLLGLQVEIEAETARLAKAEEELAKQEKVYTLRRSIDADPVLTEAARSMRETGPGLIGLELRQELVNNVYEVLVQQVAASRTKLSALQRQRSELTGTLKVGAAQVPALSRLYEKEAELAKLELELDLAKRVYSNLVVRLEDAKHTGRSTELQLIDRALPPTGPCAPRPLRDLAVSLLLGLVLSTAVALVIDFTAALWKARHVPP
jgi:uncharacterized protein involved in exopolysaccharide biosynthesis